MAVPTAFTLIIGTSVHFLSPWDFLLTRPRRYLSSRVFSRLDSAGCGLAESPDATCSYCDTFSSDHPRATGWVSRRPGVALSQRPTGTRVGEPALESPLSTAPRLLSRSFRKFLAGSGEATYAPCSLPETTFFPLLRSPACPAPVLVSPRSAAFVNHLRKKPPLRKRFGGRVLPAVVPGGCLPGWGLGSARSSQTPRTSALCNYRLSWWMRADAVDGSGLACVTSLTFEMDGGSDSLEDGGIS